MVRVRPSAGVVGCAVVVTAFASLAGTSPAPGRRAVAFSSRGRVIAGFGLRLALRPGWHAQLRGQAQPNPEFPFLVAANFPLPARDDDVGKKAVRLMTPRSVRLVLFGVGNRPGTGRFRSVKLPLRIRERDFVPSFEGIPRTHAFARRLFAVRGRSFVLWADFGGSPAPARLRRQVDQLLASLRVAPAPHVDTETLARLRRPFRVPKLAPNGRCPRSPSGRAAPEAAATLGAGPAYPVLGSATGIADLRGELFRDGWYFHKTLWAISPAYRGPLLARGRRIDRPAVVRFSLGGPPRSDLRWPGLARRAPRRWRYTPTDTLLPAAGCYAFQIDGLRFTRIVVFEARR